MGTFTDDYVVSEDRAPVDRSSLRVLDLIGLKRIRHAEVKSRSVYKCSIKLLPTWRKSTELVKVIPISILISCLDLR